MQVRRSTTLAPEDWERLDNLAALTQSTASAGPEFGEPSWRALLRRIVRNDKIMTFTENELLSAQQAFAAEAESGAIVSAGQQ
jgi:hypothetical protein